MLGLTSYQEALRAVGRLADPTSELQLIEHAEEGWLELITGRGRRQIGAAELEDIVVASLAQRGVHTTSGETSDVLRSVGLALDELHALDVCLVLGPDRLTVRFADRHSRSHELTYVGEELEALRRAATARRSGQPLRRILILQAGADPAGALAELLVAEFAVQALPIPYARAIAATSEPPDLVVAQASPAILDAIQTLRGGKRTCEVPILVLAGVESDTRPSELFAAGADDVLQEPVQPAQLRARIRTALLRGRAQ